jgi:hypothetical protein
MTFTFSNTSITTDLAKVRHLIGDTDSTDPLLTDEQITFELVEDSNIYLCAANCCDRICAQLARKIDRNGTGFSATRSQKFQHYKDLAEILRSKSSTQCDVYWSNLSLDDADSIEQDSDFIQPSFKVGQNDYE